MNITDKILLALKFEFTQKYSASKSQHCLINVFNFSVKIFIFARSAAIFFA